MRVLFVFGTRPEAIKMAPLIKLMQGRQGIAARTCVTGQHRQMLVQVLGLFGIAPDYDLNLMRAGQSLNHITSAVLTGLTKVIDDFRPDRIIVQGDTTTSFAAAIAGFYAKLPVAHVEAGLRTGNLQAPWPEEMNRRVISQFCDIHFAPTVTAADNLLREGVSPSAVEITGNTVIDALLHITNRLASDPSLLSTVRNQAPPIEESRRLILVTGHRRENFDGGLERVCRALVKIARRKDVEILYPVHLNPKVQCVADRILSGHSNIHLAPPLPYLQFVYMMQKSYLIVTDSGGIQEEAPSLGKPVLVSRETTERPEAVEAGTVELVGTDPDLLVTRISRLLDDEEVYRRMSLAHNPYGDGRASQRIVERLSHGSN